MRLNNLKDRVIYIRRLFRTKFSSLNQNIKTLFVLNDQEVVVRLNKSLKTSIFKELPDPIPEISPLPEFDVYKHYKINKNSKIFLHIGSLGDRKGTFEIIDSISSINQEKQEEITILLVGKIGSQEQRARLERKIEEINRDSQSKIIWDQNFVSNKMMKSLFCQCDAVLMPYKNVEASSGILGHAAASNKPVIASGDGLLGELVVKNKLGLVLESLIPLHIAEALENFPKKPEILDIDAQTFVLSHSPEAFAKILTS
jgi:glycosyltransferase involved in cell wall biosynthesis